VDEPEYIGKPEFIEKPGSIQASESREEPESKEEPESIEEPGKSKEEPKSREEPKSKEEPNSKEEPGKSNANREKSIEKKPDSTEEPESAEEDTEFDVLLTIERVLCWKMWMPVEEIEMPGSRELLSDGSEPLRVLRLKGQPQKHSILLLAAGDRFKYVLTVNIPCLRKFDGFYVFRGAEEGSFYGLVFPE